MNRKPGSVDRSITETRVNRGFLWRVSFIAGLGGILYGFDMGVIAGAMVFVRDSFTLSTRMEEIVVSVVLVGAMCGAVAGGSIADRIGRRATLLWGGAIFLAGSLLALWSPNVITLIVARGLLGIAVGFTSVTAPVYVSELAPPRSRGLLIGLYQFALTIGIVLADLAGYWLAVQHAWRLMFGLGAIPAALFVVLVVTLPESPRWLYAQNRIAEVRRVLSRYTDEAGAQSLIVEIRAALAIPVEQRWRELWSPTVRTSLLIAVGFTVLQQVTGINTIIYYGPRIFALAGITSNRSAISATLLVAVTNTLATVIALVLVDRVGRKPLLYAGLGGMTICLVLLAYSFHSPAAFGAAPGVVATICLMIYITCFAFSMGPIAWILVSEVFPLRVRGRGVAAASLGSGASNFLVSMTFLSLIKAAGSTLTFLIYAVFCAYSPCSSCALLSRRPRGVNWKPSVPRPMRRSLGSMNRGRSIMSKFNYAVDSGTSGEETGNTAIVHQGPAAKAPGYVVGVDVGGTNLRLALADMSGSIVAKWTVSTVAIREPNKVISLIFDGLKNILSQVQVPPSALRSIAIGVPGVTDVENGIVVATSYLMGWQNVPLRALVGKELNIPVAVDNDVNLAAVGESWVGSAIGVRDFVFLAIGTGIGAGLVLDGRPYRGSSWAAGEVGYMLVPGITEGLGKLNEPGALESMIGGEGIKTQWQNLWSAERTPLPRELNATEIFDHALNGDSQAQTILRQSAAMLAQAIYNISLVLNCPLFVLGGGVGMHPALCDATRGILKQWNLREVPRLIVSSLGEDAQLLGAVRVALDTADACATPPKRR